MDHFSNQTWGYKTSDTIINVYHHLLPKIGIKAICSVVTHAQEVTQKEDGSITIVIDSKDHSFAALDEISSFFKRIETNFIDTPEISYRIPEDLKEKLSEWSLAFAGCIGILLTHDSELRLFDWQYINSSIGGLSFGQYTLFFYKTHAKIIHPIAVRNYELRESVEKNVATYVHIIAKRMHEAQPGLEGQGMLSLLEERTSLTAKEIVKIINDKSYGVKAPSASEFFNAL